MSSTLKEIQKQLKAEASEAVKETVLKFVPDAQKVYGIANPVLNEMAKEFKEGGFELVGELWESGAFEERMLAAKLLRIICRKDPQKAIKMVKRFSKEITDWAVCDTLGMQSLKPVAAAHAEEIFSLAETLNQSADPWQRRLSLVLVEYYTRDKSLHKRIIKLMNPLEDDKEYYVKKAVQWLKRNLQKGK